MTYTTDVGDYLVVKILICPFSVYIARVIQVSPLIVKVTETGRYAELKYGRDFDIVITETAQLQSNPISFLECARLRGVDFFSGLESLGAGQKLRRIFPKDWPAASPMPET